METKIEVYSKDRQGINFLDCENDKTEGGKYTLACISGGFGVYIDEHRFTVEEQSKDNSDHNVKIIKEIKKEKEVKKDVGVDPSKVIPVDNGDSSTSSKKKPV